MNDPLGLIGRTLAGKYRVERLLGEGGFGVVYAGTHLVLGAAVAIKLLKVDALATDPARASEEYLREARILFSLSHPAIVRMYDVGALEGPVPVPWVVLELLTGPPLDRDLAERRRAGRHMSAADLRATFEPILDALAFAHARGVLHRDVKPSNIVLARAPSGALEPKLVDFGTARTQAAAFHASAGKTGFTPLYGAPEQWDPGLGPPSPATDVYSLGLTILEAATLERPHAQADGLPAIMRAALSGSGHPSLAGARTDLGVALDAFARRATAVSPAARFQSGAEMKAAFVSALGAASPHAVTGLPAAGGALFPAPTPLAPAIGHTTGAPFVSAPHTRPQPASNAVSVVAIAIAAVAVVVALAGGGAALYLARSGPATTVVLSPGGGGATATATSTPPKKAARGLSAPLVRPTSEFDQANAAEVAQKGHPALVACAEKSRRFGGTLDLTLEVDRAGKVIGTDCHTVWPRHDSKNPSLDPAATEFCSCAQTVTPKWRFAPPKPEDVPEGTPGVPKGMVAALTDSCTLRVRYTSVE